MNNPYISRGPVRVPELFFGRQHELSEIASFLKGNQSVSLVGPRKIGKTSLLFHLRRPETLAQLGLGPDYLLVYLDCEVLGEGSHDEIYGAIAGEIAATLDERGLPSEPLLEAAAATPGRLAFERAIRKLNQNGLRVILLLDEFERLSSNPGLDVNFFNALRSAAGRYQLAFVTASARPLIQLTYSGKSQEILSSPFFNIFAPLFLGLLLETEARQVIRGPSQAAGLAFSPAVEDFLYQLVGGFPLGLQVACFHAFELLHSPHVAETPALFQTIESRTQQELVAHFEYYWRNLSTAEQSVLRQIDELVWRAASDTTLRGLLRDLSQKCLLLYDGQTYRYPSKAWAAFVAAQQVATPSPSQINGLLSGTQFGSYEVLERLGRGGMAEVYKGRHTRLNRLVAIKILPPNLAAESDFRNRFEREAQAVASLRHPNIVQVFDFGDVGGTYFMVMEYIEGKDLGQFMLEHGALTFEQVLPIGRDLAAALDYAHAQGLVHRDVKPSNVLLRYERRLASAQETLPLTPGQPAAVLTDFGIAKILGGDTGATKTGLMMGTLNYMAPEQIRSAGDVDGRADIYALGVMLYQMLTGQLPFQTDNPGAMMLAHLQASPPDPRQVVAAIPASAAEAILRALEKDPNDRFASAGAMLAAMQA